MEKRFAYKSCPDRKINHFKTSDKQLKSVFFMITCFFYDYMFCYRIKYEIEQYDYATIISQL